MGKPPKRPDLPKRRSDNDKRRLRPAPDPALLNSLVERVAYQGISKHKAEPLKFGLEEYRGKRGDRTLCDADAGFSPDDMGDVPDMMRRGIRAGLIGDQEKHGDPTIIWAVADNGWIYEARITSPGRAVFHGYPVRSSEAISEPVYRRFADWAADHGCADDRKAAENCRALYGFKP